MRVIGTKKTLKEALLSVLKFCKQTALISSYQFCSKIKIIPQRVTLVFVRIYSKKPKISDTQKITVIILKFEQCGSTIE